MSIKTFLFLLVSSILISTTEGSVCKETYFNHSSKNHDGTFISCKKPGMYMIQSLMSITNGEPCTNVTIGGLIRVHAVKYAIESRNRTHNISIGYRIDDTCSSLPRTMKRAIEIINNQERRSCMTRNKGSCSVGVTSAYRSTSDQSETFLAVIGAYFSFITLPLSSLLSSFSIPQLSYRSSSPLLSKRSEYKSTFRSIPSDEEVVEAMIDVIKSFGWNYIFTVGSDDEYGKIGLRLLKKRASESGICFTGEVYIPYKAGKTRQIAKQVALQMKQEVNATVVVMFNYALKMSEYILEEAEKLNLRRIWLTGENWNPEVLSSTVISKNQLESILTVSLDFGQADRGFIDYLNGTVHKEFGCDIWLAQYIAQTFECSVTSRVGHVLTGKNVHGKACSVHIDKILEHILSENPRRINGLIDIVDSVIHAIDSFVLENCPSPSASCNKQLQPKHITEALENTSFFNRQHKQFAYDKSGNPAYASLSLEQVQYNETTQKFSYIPFGKWQSWSKPKLTIRKADIKIPFWSVGGLPTSTCSTDCTPGQYVFVQQKCCWECLECPRGNFSNTKNAKKCHQCSEGYHTRDRVSCERTPILYMTITHPTGMTASILSILGIMLTFLCLVLMHYLKDTSAVKNMSCQFIVSSAILLLLTFTYTVLHLITPTSVLCRIRNIYFHQILILFALSLLIKNSSVTRFISKFVNGKRNCKIAELILSLSIIGIESGLVLVWQCKESFPVMMTYSGYELFEECEVKFTLWRMLSFALPFVIIVVASVQSLSQRHAKFHFGEYKFLHYTCLAFCVISIVHVITLNQVTGEYKVLVTLISTISYGYIFMGCMIAPKLFHGITDEWTSRRSKNSPEDGVCNIGFQGEVDLNSPATTTTPASDITSTSFGEDLKNVDLKKQMVAVS